MEPRKHSQKYLKIKTSGFDKNAIENQPLQFLHMKSSVFDDLIGSSENFENKIKFRNETKRNKNSNLNMGNYNKRLSSFINPYNQLSSGILNDFSRNKNFQLTNFVETSKTPTYKVKNLDVFKTTSNLSLNQYNNLPKKSNENINNGKLKILKLKNIADIETQKTKTLKIPTKVASIISAKKIDKILESLDEKLPVVEKEEHFNNTENIFHSLFKNIQNDQETGRNENKNDDEKEIQRKLMVKKMFKKKKTKTSDLKSFDVLLPKEVDKEKELKNLDFFSKLKANKKIRTLDSLFGAKFDVNFYLRKINT